MMKHRLRPVTATLIFLTGLFVAGAALAQVEATLDAGDDVVIKYDHRTLPPSGLVGVMLDPDLREVEGLAGFEWEARGNADVEFDFELATGRGQALFSIPGKYLLTVTATLENGEALVDEVVVKVLALPLVKWRFDDATGVVVHDSATGKYPGNISSDSNFFQDVWEPEGGVLGGAMRFFEGDNVGVQFSAKPGSSSSFSLSMRLKPARLQASHLANKFPKGDSGGGWAVTLDEDGGLHFLIGSKENYADLRVTDGYSTDEWRHLVCAYQGATEEDPRNSSAEIFIDGVPQEVTVIHRSAQGDLPAEACRLPTIVFDGEGTGLQMGTSDVDEEEDQYVGLIDDAAIYPTSLSHSQMVAIASVPSAPTAIFHEFLRSGGDALIQLEAIDADECEEHRFSLVEGEGSAYNQNFTIAGRWIYFVKDIPPAPRTVVTLRVRATDKDGLTLDKVITFEILRGSGGGGFVGGGGGSGGGGSGGGEFSITLPEPGARSPATDWWLEYAGEHPQPGAVVAGGISSDAEWSPYDGGFDHEFIAGGIDNDRFSIEVQPRGRFLIVADEALDLSGDRFFTVSVGARDAAGDVTVTEVRISAVRLRLNEFVADNRFGLMDEDGNRQDWIEIHNASAAPVHLGGWALSNHPDQLDRWPLPLEWVIGTDGYEVVFASGKDRFDGKYLHLASDLQDQRCEFLSLSYPSLGHVETSYVFVPNLGKDDAFGLVGDDPTKKALLENPSPGRRNPVAPPKMLLEPELSVESGYYDTPFEVLVERAEPDRASVLRYTLDGVEPGETSAVVAGNVPITGLAVLKVRAFAEGYLPSRVVSRTYLFVDDVLGQEAMRSAHPDLVRSGLISLPAMAISVDEDGMFGDRGVYSQPGLDREIQAGFEFFVHPDSGLENERFESTAGLSLSGRRSLLDSPKHALRLKFRKRFGAGKFRKKFFGEGLAGAFDDLVLRTAFNQSWVHEDPLERDRSQNLRDRFARETHLSMGRLSPHSRPVHLYINGRYWGIYEPTELPDDLFQSAYFGCQQSDYETIDAGAAKDGGKMTQAEWDSLVNIAQVGNLADPLEYQAVAEAIDLEDFIDFVLLHTYLGNANVELMGGPTWEDDNNYFAGRHSDGKWGWRFFVWDAEETLLGLDDNFLQSAGRPAILLKLIRNSDFRIAFADRVFEHLFEGGALTAERSRSRYAALAHEIDLAIHAEAARWGWVERPGDPYDHADWEVEKARLLDEYFPQRSEIVIEQLRLGGLYPGIDPPTVSFDSGSLIMAADLGEIYYTLDGSDPRSPGGGVAPGALRFTGAVPIGMDVPLKARAMLNRGWSALRDEMVVAGPVAATSQNFKLTEILHTGAVEFLEFWNPSDRPVAIGGLISNDEGQFVFPEGMVLEPGAYILAVSDILLFEEFYGGGFPILQLDEKLTKRGRVRVRNLSGIDIVEVEYGRSRGWPVAAREFGFSLVPDASTETGWRASSYKGGSPGSPDPEVDRADSVVVNELLSNPVEGEEDAIELHNLGDVLVSLGGWFLTDDLKRDDMYVIPDGTEIGAGEYLVLSAENFGFGFRAGGEEVYLIAADPEGDPTGYVHGFAYSETGHGDTVGRYVIPSTDEEWFVLMQSPTLGGPNSGPWISGLIVNEVMYHPDVPPAPEDPEIGEDGEELPPLGENDLEFVELLNVSDDPIEYGEISVAPGELILLIRRNECRFREHYRLSDEVRVLLTLGHLGNASGIVQVKIDSVPVDIVWYTDEKPWPRSAGGDGRSLERLTPAGFGSDPTNWEGSCAPGGSPGRLRAISYEEWQLEQFGQATDPLGDANSNGLVNLLEYAFGYDPTGTEPVRRPRMEFGEAGQTMFRFRRRIGRQTDLVFQLEESSDLNGWQEVEPDGIVEEHTLDNRDGTEDVTWILEDGRERFSRLVVSLLR